jgi:hypothetical protein
VVGFSALNIGVMMVTKGKKTQVQKFREAARAAETDDSEDRFNATLKGLAKAPREAKAPKGQPGKNDPHKDN